MRWFAIPRRIKTAAELEKGEETAAPKGLPFLIHLMRLSEFDEMKVLESKKKSQGSLIIIIFFSFGLFQLGPIPRDFWKAPFLF